LFAPDRRLYCGRQLEPWWFCVRANTRLPDLDPNQRISGANAAAACSLSADKLAADLCRELLHMVNAADAQQHESCQLSMEYGRAHEARVRRLVQRLLLHDRVPIYELGFVVKDGDELLGASPDGVVAPFRWQHANATGTPQAYGLLLEIKCSARALHEHPSVAHVVQLHQQMYVTGLQSHGWLAGYHQDALRVWDIAFDPAFWAWVELRLRYFDYLRRTYHNEAPERIGKSTLLLRTNMARDTTELWFGKLVKAKNAPRRQPLNLAAMSDDEKHFLDHVYRGRKSPCAWRDDRTFVEQCLVNIPYKPAIRLLYEHTFVSPRESTFVRDRHGLVPREHWPRDSDISEEQWGKFACFDLTAQARPLLAAPSALDTLFAPMTC
jgi:hypothetical protein